MGDELEERFNDSEARVHSKGLMNSALKALFKCLD